MKLTAPGFRRVTTEGIGADPAFASSYEQQRAGLASLHTSKVPGITTSADVDAVRCRGLVRKLKYRFLDAGITDAERVAAEAHLPTISDNPAKLEAWHRNIGLELERRRAARALAA